MDTATAFASIAGILGTLGGVAVGAWFSARAQRQLLHEGHRREDRQARREACVEYLSAVREYRMYLLTGDYEVVVTPSGNQDGRVASIKGSPEPVTALQRASGKLRLMEGGLGRPIVEASRTIQREYQRLMVARASGAPAQELSALVDVTRQAEWDFVQVAHEELARE